MQKTNIEWTDYTWNPIKGICPVGCWYCYARAMYKRFKWLPEVRFSLNNSDYTSRFSNKLKLKPGTKIFICSTFEMFHPVVKKEWRDIIFLIIESNPDLTFQILTKFPENIDRPMPDNVWLGVSVTGDDNTLVRMAILKDTYAKVKFVSYEPFLSEVTSLPLGGIDWLIVGRLTGHGKKHDPPIEWIETQSGRAIARGIPIFMKDNLRSIWGEVLIQEMPEGK